MAGGGVQTEKGEYVQESALEAENLMNGIYEAGDVHEVSESAIYLGCFIKQWGHFLLDFVPRLWYLINNDDSSKKLVYVSMYGQRIDGVYEDFLKLYGIDRNRLECVLMPTKYNDVTVPQTSYSRPYSYTKEYAQVFNHLKENLSKTNLTYPNYEKIYWTRTKLKKAKRTEFGEKKLEQLFAANGYKVLAPERLSLQQQVYYFSSCKHMAGVSGSIPHNLVFSDKDTEFVILNRTYRINVNQFPINEMCGAKVIYVDCHASFFPNSADKGPYWLTYNDNLEKFADDINLTVPAGVKNSKGKITQKDWAKYCTLYFNTYSGNELGKTDAGMAGDIAGRSRPLSEGVEEHEIYYFYRTQFKSIVSYDSFMRGIKNSIKTIMKKLMKK